MGSGDSRQGYEVILKGNDLIGNFRGPESLTLGVLKYLEGNSMVYALEITERAQETIGDDGVEALEMIVDNANSLAWIRAAANKKE